MLNKQNLDQKSNQKYMVVSGLEYWSDGVAYSAEVASAAKAGLEC